MRSADDRRHMVLLRQTSIHGYSLNPVFAPTGIGCGRRAKGSENFGVPLFVRQSRHCLRAYESAPCLPFLSRNARIRK